MRQWVTPRSLMLHVVFLAIATGCLIAGWWQIHRAMAGNTLSYLYSVEWPAFVVVAGIGWWQMFHDTPDDIARRKEHHERARAAGAAVAARSLPRSAFAIDVDSTDAGGGRRQLDAGGSLAIGAKGAGPAEAALVAFGAGDGRDLPVIHDEAAMLGEETLPDDDLARYNRYLATLAVKGKPKTWRNPRGE